MRALVAIVSMTFLTMLVADGASAQSCSALRGQLAAAQSGSASGGQLAKLRRQARAYGCNSASRWGKHRACAGIEAKMRRAGGGVDSRKVKRLQRQIARQCSSARQRQRQEPQRQARRTVRAPANGVIIHGTRADNHLDERARRGRGLFGGLFDGFLGDDEVTDVETAAADPRRRVEGRTVERVNLNEAEPRRTRTRDRAPARTLATRSQERTGRRALREGRARTVCVRLCDGFYFPINSRSHSDNFYDELAMCVGRCPGADVSLYTHHQDAPVESMRSTMTGERYVDLPTAFTYRKERVAGCGCVPQTTVAGDMDADKALGYVGLDRQTAAEDAANAASKGAGAEAGGTRWKRLTAVYDETGKPLDLMAYTDTAESSGTNDKVRTDNAVAATTAPDNMSDRARRTVAAGGSRPEKDATSAAVGDEAASVGADGEPVTSRSAAGIDATAQPDPARAVTTPTGTTAPAKATFSAPAAVDADGAAAEGTPGDQPQTVRNVGPRFYRQGFAAQEEPRARTRRRASTAVTIVPLPSEPPVSAAPSPADAAALPSAASSNLYAGSIVVEADS